MQSGEHKNESKGDSKPSLEAKQLAWRDHYNISLLFNDFDNVVTKDKLPIENAKHIAEIGCFPEENKVIAVLKDADDQMVCVSWDLDNLNKMQRNFTINGNFEYLGHFHILSDRLVVLSDDHKRISVYDLQGHILQEWKHDEVVRVLQLSSTDELVELEGQTITKWNIRTGKQIGEAKTFPLETQDNFFVKKNMSNMQVLSNGDLVFEAKSYWKTVVLDGVSLKIKKEFDGFFLRESKKGMMTLGFDQVKGHNQIWLHTQEGNILEFSSKRYMNIAVDAMFKMMLPNGDLFLYIVNSPLDLSNTWVSSLLIINENGKVVVSKEGLLLPRSNFFNKQVADKSVAMFRRIFDKTTHSSLGFLPRFIKNQFVLDVKKLISTHTTASIADLVLGYAGTENISRENFTNFINYLKKHLSDFKEFPSEGAKADNLSFLGGLAASIGWSSPIAKYNSLRTSTLKSLDNILTNLEERKIEFDQAISELLKVINNFRHALAGDKGIYLSNFLKVLCIDKLFVDFAASLSPVMTSDDLAFLISYLKENKLLEVQSLSLAM